MSQSLDYEQERLKLELSEEVFKAMQAQGMNQADLARAIGKSRAYVTKILQGSSNFTLATAAALLWALECRLQIKVIKK